MSRLNLETTKTLPLLEPISPAPLAGSLLGTNSMFGLLLQRARSALDDPPAARPESTLDAENVSAAPDGRHMAEGSPPKNDCAPEDPRADSVPPGNSPAEKPPAPTPDTDTSNSQEATKGDSDPTTGSQEAAAEETTDSPDPLEQAGPGSDASTELDPASQDTPKEDPDDEREDEFPSDGEAAVGAGVAPVDPAVATLDPQAVQPDAAGDGVTGKRVAVKLSARQSAPTGDQAIQPGAGDSAGGPAEPEGEGESSPAASSTQPRAAQEKSAPAGGPPIHLTEVSGEPSDDGQNATDEGHDRAGGPEASGKRRRATAAGHAVPADAEPSETVAPKQPPSLATSAPQPSAVPSPSAGAVAADAAENTAPAQAGPDRSSTGDSTGVPRVAQDRAVSSSAVQSASDVPDTSHVDRVRFVQRVARAFESIGDRGGAIRLRLHPPELGSLRLEVTVRNGVMSARLEAETQTAQSMLLEHLPALRERLAEQNIRIERFEVDLMGQSPGGSPDGADAQAWSRQGRPPDRPHSAGRSEAGAERAAGLRRSPTAGSPSQFDVIV